MKKILFFVLLITNTFLINNLISYSNDKNYITISQRGTEITIKWKFPGNIKPKEQTLYFEEIEEDDNGNDFSTNETIYKLSPSQRNKVIKDLKKGTKYSITIMSNKPEKSISKIFSLKKVPSMPSDLDYSWNNNKPIDNLSLFWKYDGEKVDNWIISVYKSNIVLPEDNEDLSTLEELNNQQSENETEIESIIKRLVIKGSSRKYNITGLNKIDNYRILLEGRNKSGLGEYNNISISQSAPNEPINLKVEKSNASKDTNPSLIITWEYAGIEIDSFNIGVRAAGFKEDLKVYKVSPNVRSFTINNLSKGGYYQFVIKAVNQYSYATAITEPYFIKIAKNKPKDPLQEKLEEEAGGPIDSTDPIEENNNEVPTIPLETGNNQNNNNNNTSQQPSNPNNIPTIPSTNTTPISG